MGCAHHHRPAPVVQKPPPKTPYAKPLLSPGALFGTLPPAVQNTVRAEVGSTEVRDVVKEDRNGETVYKIHFQVPEIYPPLYIAPDGSVLRSDLSVAVKAPEVNRTGLKLTDLPPDTLKVIHDRAPSMEIATIGKELWGDRTVYIVTFKLEDEHPKLYVMSDGTVLNEVPR